MTESYRQGMARARALHCLGAVDVLRVEHFTAEGFERFLTSRRDPLEPEYRNYAAGAAWITVLHRASPRRLVRPMPLQELVPGLRAPQMWCRTEIELPPELLHPAAFRAKAAPETVDAVPGT